MNEADFISRLRASCDDNTNGIHTFDFQEDAALLDTGSASFILTKDIIVEGVHFPHGICPGDAIRKAIRVNMSDIAAKGATPFLCLTGMTLPRGYSNEAADTLIRALHDESNYFGFTIAGGDTVYHEGSLSLSVTAIGVPSIASRPFVSRGGAADGDILYIIGTIGDAYIGLQGALHPHCTLFTNMSPDDRAYVLSRYHIPVPCMAAASALSRYASASMDVSDGLLLDASRMANASGITLHIDSAAIPYSAAARRALQASSVTPAALCTGGDDYAVLCAVPPEHRDAFERHIQSIVNATLASIGCATPQTSSSLTFSGAYADTFNAAFANGGGYLHT